MLRRLDNKNMGKSDLGWLKSIFHFSFSNYHNPDNMDFGVLRVINNRDALEIVEEDIIIKSKDISHVLIIEMKKD